MTDLHDKEKGKTFQDFMDDLLCKQENPYDKLKDAKPYHKFRNLAALVNGEMHEQMKGAKFYEENKHDLWRIIDMTVAAVLYVQSQIKEESL